MKLTLRQQLTQFGHVLQDSLFPLLEERCGALDDTAKRLVATLELIPLGRFIPSAAGWVGRPAKDRYALACAFVAKAVYGMSQTRELMQRLRSDEQLRKLCGWNRIEQVPSESKFSRAFAEFAEMELPQCVHEALIRETQKERLVGHISRDATAIEARERFPAEPGKVKSKSKRRADEERKRTRKRARAQPTEIQERAARGEKRRPRGPHRRHKGGKPKYTPPADTRLHWQRGMKLSEMLAELPRHCSLGVKTSSDGNQKYFRGYKLHLDVADGQIPISAVLTAASLHDSQVAIPLATMTAQRVTNLYDVMDSAYDATEILEHSRGLGHVPIVQPVKRLLKEVPFQGAQYSRSFSMAEAIRYRERTTVERVNARLKDEFGGRQIWVRGAKKVMAHVMFGILALTADQLQKLIR
jgi:transposase